MSSAVQVDIGQRLSALRTSKNQYDELKDRIKDVKFMLGRAEERGDDSFKYNEELARLEERLERQKTKMKKAMSDAREVASHANLGADDDRRNMDRLRLLEISEENGQPQRTAASNRPAGASQRSVQGPSSSIRHPKGNQPKLTRQGDGLEHQGLGRPASTSTPRPKSAEGSRVPPIGNNIKITVTKSTLPKPTERPAELRPRTTAGLSRLAPPKGWKPPTTQATYGPGIPVASSTNLRPPTYQATSRIAQPVFSVPSSRVPQFDNATKIRQQIERHQNKQRHAGNIAKFGNLRNMKQHAILENIPKVIAPEEVRERRNVYKDTVKNAKTVGNLKRQAAGPRHAQCELLCFLES